MERLAGRIILLWGWRRALVAFLAGALTVLGQAPYDFFAACFVSFPALVLLLDGATGEPGAGRFGRLRPAFGIGWWFGFGYFLAGLWWIGGAMLVEADSFAWALPLATIGIPLGLAFFYGFATAVARLLWSDGIGRIAALAFGFALAEWLRSFLFTGFPWNAVGYAAMPVPLLMQSVSVVGMNGMNALAVFVFSMPALLANRRHGGLGLGLAALLVIAHVGKAKRIADLFAGAGTFTLRLARIGRVHAAESDDKALKALDHGARNTQGLKPVTVEKRDLFRRPLTAQELKVFDAVVFDPPRAGAEAQVKEIARSGVKKIVAVSCNPLTLARDLAILIEAGYRLTRVTPIDQFLWSPHVEAVAVVEKA